MARNQRKEKLGESSLKEVFMKEDVIKLGLEERVFQTKGTA